MFRSGILLLLLVHALAFVATMRCMAQENLVINGDFNDHWSTGWEKKIADRTKGNLTVEIVPSTSDVSDKLLHIALSGENTGWVEQTITLPEGQTLKNLQFRAEVKMMPKVGGGILPKPIQMMLIVQFLDKDDKKLAEIWYANFQKTAFTDSALAGTPKTYKATGDRCVINVGDGYHRIEESLDQKVMDCVTGANLDEIRKVVIAPFIITGNGNDSADFYLDKVSLRYSHSK